MDESKRLKGFLDQFNAAIDVYRSFFRHEYLVLTSTQVTVVIMDSSILALQVIEHQISLQMPVGQIKFIVQF